MTLKIMNSTSQAPPRCEPLKRDSRPSFAGEFRSRMTAKVVIADEAEQGDEVLQEAEHRPVADHRDVEVAGPSNAP